MKKLVLLVMVLLIPILVSAKTWKVKWASISATTQAAAPASYISINGTVSASGIPINGNLKGFLATCFTVGANATDTDFNFLYSGQSANAHELCGEVGEASNCSWSITMAGDHIRFTADNDDTADAVTPYCEVIIW